jgi:hypothetical protein
LDPSATTSCVFGDTLGQAPVEFVAPGGARRNIPARSETSGPDSPVFSLSGRPRPRGGRRPRRGDLRCSRRSPARHDLLPHVKVEDRSDERKREAKARRRSWAKRRKRRDAPSTTRAKRAPPATGGHEGCASASMTEDVLART